MGSAQNYLNSATYWIIVCGLDFIKPTEKPAGDSHTREYDFAFLQARRASKTIVSRHPRHLPLARHDLLLAPSFLTLCKENALTLHQRDAGVIEGGALSGALPHFSLGREPIWKMSLPPLIRSSCVNHGLSSVCPFNVAD